MSEEKKITIPLVKTKAKLESPKNLIIFSKPKTGKTSAYAELPNNLILDFEDGSDYIEGMVIKIETLADLKEVGKQIKEAGYPYDFVTIDTITSLDKITIPYAEQLYSNTLPGKNWYKKNTDGTYAPDSGKAKYGNIINMPEGAGYKWLWEAHTKVVEFIKGFAPRLIQSGHIKDVNLEKQSTVFASMELDLSGKLKRIVTSASDAIGYLYRKGNQNILSFKTTDDVACGARPEHLSNVEIILSEKTETGFVTYWERIYPELAQKKEEIIEVKPKKK